MSIDGTTTPEDLLRQQAIRRLKKQSDFRLHLLIYVMVNTFLVVLWLMSGRFLFFWPVFPIFGWGIGVAANFWDAYLREDPSEADISREMTRQRDRGPASG